MLVNENEKVLKASGLTEERLIEVLERKGYNFSECVVFDKNLFLDIAWDHYEYNEDEKLWYERESDQETNEFVYLCNECHEMYDEELDQCELIGCNGSIRKVSKGDMGLD